VAVLILFPCAAHCTGESSFEVKIEADSYDIIEHPHDGKIRMYLCTLCDERFPSKDSLNKHKQIHNVDRFFSCTQCEKRFATQDSLRKHMNIHSSKYKCTECGKCFSSNKDFAKHRRSHSGEKPFECTVCSKRFTQSGNLTVHSRIHSGEKPHKCPECDKAFNQSGNLNRHMRVHTGDKPYKCSLCDKSFSQLGHLQCNGVYSVCIVASSFLLSMSLKIEQVEDCYLADIALLYLMLTMHCVMCMVNFVVMII